MRTNHVPTLLLTLALIMNALPIARTLAQQTSADSASDTVTAPEGIAQAQSVKFPNLDRKTTKHVEEQDKAQLEHGTVSGSVGGNWHTECVDCAKSFKNMTNRSLQLDDANHPHMAYGGDHLYYARHDGASWQIETVNPAFKVGAHASLMLDEFGRPHISYFDSANSDLKYAWHDGAV